MSPLRQRRHSGFPIRLLTIRYLNVGARARERRSLFTEPADQFGTSAIQLAKRAGLKVIGSASTAKGMELIVGEGADQAVDHTRNGYLDEVKRLTGGKGPELILEMLANINLAADMDLVAKYGRIIVIGNRGEITINPRVAMMKELDIRGIALWNATPEQVKPIMHDILAGVPEGAIRPIIGREMPLADAAAAHVAVLQPGSYGKIVLVP